MGRRGVERRTSARRYVGHLGLARRPVAGGVARRRRLSGPGVAGRGPSRVGLVARDRNLRRAGAVLEIFGGADDPWRAAVSLNRAPQPPLAVTAAALCRRLRRTGPVSAGADLECAARLGLVFVSGRARRRSSLPVRAIGGDWRRGPLLSAVDLAAAGHVRSGRVAPRPLGSKPLAARLPGGAADRLLHRGRGCGAISCSTGRPPAI